MPRLTFTPALSRWYRRPLSVEPPVHALGHLNASRASTTVVQRFCESKAGGSNPSPGTILRTPEPAEADDAGVDALEPVNKGAVMMRVAPVEAEAGLTDAGGCVGANVSAGVTSRERPAAHLNTDLAALTPGAPHTSVDARQGEDSAVTLSDTGLDRAAWPLGNSVGARKGRDSAAASFFAHILASPLSISECNPTVIRSNSDTRENKSRPTTVYGARHFCNDTVAEAA